MKDMKNLFEDIDNFMICSPTLPVELFFSIFCRYVNLTKNDLFNVLNSSGFDHQFIQCVLSESIHLHTKLMSFLTDRYIRDEGHLFDLLYKHFIKNSILCEPSGLFNGIEFGKYSNRTSFSLNSSETKKFVQPNTQWLKKVTKKIEKENITLLKYKLNECVCINNDDVEITDTKTSHITYQDELDHIEALGILKNQFHTNYVSFSDLCNILTEKYNSLTEKNIFKYIEYLIEKEYLVSNLQLPLSQTNPLDQLIIQLENSSVNKNIIDKLKLINLQINSYSISSVNQSENLYIGLIEKMVGFIPADKLLDINLKTNFKNNELNKKIILEINELINLLLLFSNSKINCSSSVTELKNSFIEKYRPNSEINLSQFLNEIDPLEYYPISSPEAKKISFNRSVEKYFKEKYKKCIDFQSKSFSILDDEIAAISLSDYVYDDIPFYLEINLSVIEDKDGLFHYTVSSHPKSIIDSIFLRKAPYMAENYNLMLDSVTSNINNISNNKDEYIFCSISSYYDSKNQIMPNKQNCVPVVTISDITIGIRNNKFYLKSKSLNKQIIPIFNSIFNDTECLETSRFLYSITFDDVNFKIMPWDVLFGSLPYCPEIKYKKFILKPETWIINKIYLQINKRCKFSVFERAFQDYRVKHSIPNLVYMNVGDIKLLLNLDNIQSMKILYREFFNHDNDIVLTRYPSEYSHPIKFKDYSYACELSIPLIKKSPNPIENQNL